MSEQPTLCRGCGKPIVWAETHDGKKIPLDPRPPVYLVKDDPLVGKIAERTVNYLVTHFATCSQANRFSASKRAAVQS